MLWSATLSAVERNTLCSGAEHYGLWSATLRVVESNTTCCGAQHNGLWSTTQSAVEWSATLQKRDVEGVDSKERLAQGRETLRTMERNTT